MAEQAQGQETALQQYGVNLTEIAREGKLDPVIGRDAEIRRVSQVLIRRAVAVQAPGHTQRLFLEDRFHLVDAAVTGHAANTAGHMRAMVEVHVVGGLVNPHPGNRLPRRRALPDQRELRIILQHLIVAVHAGGRGGDVGVRRLLDAVVAVAAVDPELIRVNRVRERHGLLRLVTNARVLGREIIPHARHRSGAQKRSADNEQHGQTIGPPGKDVRHFSCSVDSGGRESFPRPKRKPISPGRRLSKGFHPCKCSL